MNVKGEKIINWNPGLYRVFMGLLIDLDFINLHSDKTVIKFT